MTSDHSKYEIYNQLKSDCLKLVSLVKLSLTEDQLIEIESNLDVGELRLAFEFTIDFLMENNVTLSDEICDFAEALQLRLGSSRSGVKMLKN